MEWIKRNILFVVGSVVAVALMGLAAFYLISGSKKNDAALEQLNAEYALLERLNNQNPHPGDESTDNIAAAKKQKGEVDELIKQASEAFRPVNSIPSGTNVNNAMFAGALRKTVDQLQTEATRRGVQVPTNFYFSFTAVRDRIMFDRPGLLPLATQLGEVKAICDVLIDARVNALDSVRREKVSLHDTEAQSTTDYLTDISTTNEIAILAPYEVSFRCFSSELAAVLSGYASSPHGLIVRAMNVEPASSAGSATANMFGGDGFSPYQPGATLAYPASNPAMDAIGQRRSAAAATATPGVGAYPGASGLDGNRYASQGAGGGLAGNRYADGNRYGTPGTSAYDGNRYGGANTSYTTPGMVTPTTPAYPTYPTATLPGYGRAPSTTRGGLPTMLDEKQLKVTMLVQVVRLTSKN